MIKCTKSRQFLIFTNDENKSVKYDLAEQRLYGLSGRPVKSLGSFFSGYSIDSIEWENPAYGTYIELVRRANRRCSNVGTFLSLIPYNDTTETWIAAGFTPSFFVRRDMKDFSKPVLKLLKELDPSLNSLGWYNGHYHTEERFVKFANVALNFLEELKEIPELSIYPLNELCSMSELYGMDAKSLILNVFEYVQREGMGIREVIRNLRDYNSMMSKMTDKYHKYPKYLLTMHQIAIKNFNSYQEKHDKEVFEKSVDKSLSHEGVRYCILVPDTPEDVQQEGANMNNCVGGYVKSIINGSCQIVFMRLKKKPDKSLVTVEIRGDKVVQAKRPYNNSINSEELAFLNTYAKAKGFTVSKHL